MTARATLDKQNYTPGETMTLTVVTSPGDRDVFTPVPGRVTVDPDADGPIQPVTVDYVAQRKSSTPAKISVTDPDRTWTPGSDDGVTAVFTSKA